MADYFGAAGDLISGVTSFFGGEAASSGAKQAEAYYKQAAAITEQSTALKELGAQRQTYQLQSTAQADVGASGLAQTGSAADVLRSNAQQASMTKSIIEQQGRITEQAYLGQAGEAAAEAQAAQVGGGGGLLGGVLGAVGSIFSDDDLKENIQLIEYREDGIHIYQFNYKGHPTRWQGVLASEVEVHRPDAVYEDANGHRKVNYEMIGREFKRIG